MPWHALNLRTQLTVLPCAQIRLQLHTSCARGKKYLNNLNTAAHMRAVYAWFSDASAVWLVLEFCEGGDLFRVMADHGGRLDEHYVCVEVRAGCMVVLFLVFQPHVMKAGGPACFG